MRSLNINKKLVVNKRYYYMYYVIINLLRLMYSV